MKKIILLLLASGLFFETFAQSDSKIWVGIDGAFWQKSVKSVRSENNHDFSSSIRPMIGYNFSDKWSLGIMPNFQNYSQDEGTISFRPTNFATGQSDDRFSVRYGTKNNVFGLGAFLRRDVELSERASLNFSLYTMREFGDDGLIFQDFDFSPCITCLSIAIPEGKAFSEVNWRTGLDLAFAYQATNWLALELRANLVELRLQEITDPNPNLSNIAPNPFESSFRSFYGEFTDFGSAVRRDGIRFGLVISPF